MPQLASAARRTARRARGPAMRRARDLTQVYLEKLDCRPLLNPSVALQTSSSSRPSTAPPATSSRSVACAMRYFLMMMVATAVAQQGRGTQEVCWDMKSGYNAVSRMVPSPRAERRPEVFYFGELSGAEQCSVACAKEPACAAFTYMGAAS
eukprot:scaffold7854_cov76-Phaeocystis_antarctica.AAC.9